MNRETKGPYYFKLPDIHKIRLSISTSLNQVMLMERGIENEWFSNRADIITQAITSIIFNNKDIPFNEIHDHAKEFIKENNIELIKKREPAPRESKVKSSVVISPTLALIMDYCITTGMYDNRSSFVCNAIDQYFTEHITTFINLPILEFYDYLMKQLYAKK